MTAITRMVCNLVSSDSACDRRIPFASEPGESRMIHRTIHMRILQIDCHFCDHALAAVA